MIRDLKWLGLNWDEGEGLLKAEFKGKDSDGAI